MIDDCSNSYPYAPLNERRSPAAKGGCYGQTCWHALVFLLSTKNSAQLSTANSTGTRARPALVSGRGGEQSRACRARAQAV